MQVSYYEYEDHFRDGSVLFLWRRTPVRTWMVDPEIRDYCASIVQSKPLHLNLTFILREVYLPDISQDHSLLDQFYNAENNFNSNQPNNSPFKCQAMFLT